MTTNKLGRVAFSLTAALTTAGLVAVPATAASNAPDVFSGAARANALELDITAPADVLGLLGMESLNLGVSLTDVTTTSAGASAAAADLLRTPLLTQRISSESGEANGESSVIPPTEVGPLSIGVGNMSYTIDEVTNAVHSESELAHVRLSLAGALPALPEVDNAVNTVTADIEVLVGDIVNELNGVLGELETTLEETAGLPIDIPNVPVDAVLSDVLNADLDTTLVDIRKLWSETSVTPIDGVVRSTAHAGIVGADILAGTIVIPEFSYSAWAQAGGAPGTADAGFETKNLALHVLGEEIISLDGSDLTVAGVSLDLNDPTFAGLPVADALAPISDLVGDLLNVAGVDYALGEGTTEVSADGTYASATVSAFSLSIAPLHAATAIPELADVVSTLGVDSADEILHINLNLLPVTAEARASQVAVAAQPSLPRTGGGAAAMLLGLVGMGSAAVLRRKF